MRTNIKNHENYIGHPRKINEGGHGTDRGKDQKPINQGGIGSADSRNKEKAFVNDERYFGVGY
jgi:hypothetical protein